jgi:hypothetical protein
MALHEALPRVTGAEANDRERHSEHDRPQTRSRAPQPRLAQRGAYGGPRSAGRAVGRYVSKRERK